jgi:hypothetical protein
MCRVNISDVCVMLRRERNSLPSTPIRSAGLKQVKMHHDDALFMVG